MGVGVAQTIPVTGVSDVVGGRLYLSSESRSGPNTAHKKRDATPCIYFLAMPGALYVFTAVQAGII